MDFCHALNLVSASSTRVDQGHTRRSEWRVRHPTARMLLPQPLPLSTRWPVLGFPVDDMAVPLGGTGRARQVWDVLRVGGDPFSSSGSLGKKARRALEASFTPPNYREMRSTTSACGTHKLLIELEKGEAVETVIIPTPASAKSEGFSTLCVSSQVGCRQACSFCATGTMGLLRSLGPEEILAQVHAAFAASIGHGMPPIRNVVNGPTAAGPGDRCADPFCRRVR